MRTCEVIENGEQCERKHYAKGMCQKHYTRCQRNGDPLTVKYNYEKREHDKWCHRCQDWLPKANFSTLLKSSDGLESNCKNCEIDRTRQRRYGITQDRFDLMLAGQGGTCAVCETTEPGGSGSWHVDHDHSCCPGEKSCGKCVRALLCSNCNTGLGKFDDDPDRLLAAAMYILKHTTNTEVTQ